MSRRTRFPLVALLAVAACDRDPPTVPAAPGTPRPTPIASAPPATTEAARAERLAAAVARALRNPHFRADLKQRIDASPVRERKLHFQRFLTDAGRRALGDIARESRLPAATLEADATAAGALELYLPVPEHRRRWSGDENVLVATALRDGDAPVAYDLDGQRYVLDRDQPPTTPVIAIVPAETDFDRVAGPARAICVPSDEDDCAPQGGGGGGGGSPPPPPPPAPPAPGLYMTYAHMVDDFEGWLKGSPEFEIHIMGQAGTSDSLVKYQCAGEHAGGPYAYDQNGLDWSGSVLLFSQAQIDAYKQQHPGHSFRIIALEDDDTACVMKVSQDRWAALMNAINAAFRDLTGARDTLTFVRLVKAARSLQAVLSKAASWILTNDELIGNAIEDKVVAEFHPGANWIIRGENNVTNGWIKLEMR